MLFQDTFRPCLDTGLPLGLEAPWHGPCKCHLAWTRVQCWWTSSVSDCAYLQDGMRELWLCADVSGQNPSDEVLVSGM